MPLTLCLSWGRLGGESSGSVRVCQEWQWTSSICHIKSLHQGAAWAEVWRCESPSCHWELHVTLCSGMQVVLKARIRNEPWKIKSHHDWCFQGTPKLHNCFFLPFSPRHWPGQVLVATKSLLLRLECGIVVKSTDFRVRQNWTQILALPLNPALLVMAASSSFVITQSVWVRNLGVA